MRVFVASSKKYIGKINEDVYLVDEIEKKGFEVSIDSLEKIIDVSEEGDVVILKSIWGYHENYRMFQEQISFLKEKKVKLVNDYIFVFWNMYKNIYINDLNKIKFIPTEVISISENRDIKEIKNKIAMLSKSFSTNFLVIKPSVSASGYMTFKIDVNDVYDRSLDKVLTSGSDNFLIQPFRQEINNGEDSIIIINGEIKFGAKRFPGLFSEKKDIEYVDKESIDHGCLSVTKDVINEILTLFEQLPTVMRVDILKRESGFEVMEVELIDPDLFLKHAPQNVRNEAVSDIVSFALNK